MVKYDNIYIEYVTILQFLRHVRGAIMIKFGSFMSLGLVQHEDKLLSLSYTQCINLLCQRHKNDLWLELGLFFLAKFH